MPYAALRPRLGRQGGAPIGRPQTGNERNRSSRWRKIGCALISPRLLRFIQGSIKSVWAIELLLLMRRNAERAWRAEELTRELRSSLLIVADALQRFKTIGLLQEDPEQLYRYRPTTEELAQLADELAKLHASNPVALTEAIFSAPDRKLRLFADAFRLKKE